MDLIYTNAAKEDLGVLFDYQFDLAFGSDENDFQLQLALNNHCCEAGYFIYIEGTEYGGIIDSVEVDTEQQTVVYSGRTWHGILSGHVIQPDSGFDYYVAEGDANAVIADIIARLGLEDTFTASADASEIEIVKHKFARYTDAYSGICDMLSSFSAKLKMEHKVDTIVLSAVWRKDYSKDEEWDDSQVAFTVKKNYRPVNHLICLGGGDLKNRHIIHLFTDENGGVQPYATTSRPDEDADYILDNSKQLLFGVEEVTEVYDYSNAQTVGNHILLTEQPEDWSSNYEDYFKHDSENGFVNVEGKWVDEYTALTEQPSDWEEAFANYFTLSYDKYIAVEGDPTANYELQTKKPADWEENYNNYFVYWSDGLTYKYNKVSSVTKDHYLMQTMKPSDWETNYQNYYYWSDVLVDHETQTFRQAGYYSLPMAVSWKPNRFYTKVNQSVAPTWEPETYYTSRNVSVAPAFVSGSFYSHERKPIKPPFVADTYFRLAYDHYADLVAGGLERLKSSLYSDSVKIEFDLDGDYDIGDIVGAHDQSTGIDVWQPVTKKIITIKNGAVSIDIETDPPKATQRSSSGSLGSGGSIGGILTDGADGQDGKDGADGISCTHEWNGTVLTVTSASGTSSADLKGEQGEPGKDGQDGYTPVKGVDYFDGEPGKDGQDGSPGKDGQDGYTPVKGVDYFDGQDGKDGADGQDGSPGQDGYTPVKGVDYFDGEDGQPGKDGADGVSVTHEWNGTVLTITSASGTSSADLKGEKGEPGESSGGSSAVTVLTEEPPVENINEGEVYAVFQDASTETVSRPRLPDAYIEVEYIESSGTQYIDTGFYPKYNSRVITIVSDLTSTSFVYGTRSANSKTAALQFCFYRSSETAIRTDYFGTNATATVTDTTEKATIDQNGNITNAYGQEMTNTAVTSGECTYPLCLFALNNVGAVKNFGTFKLYACQIYDNGTLVRDFVPCTKTDGTPGLYDMVNGVFYANAGTGAFAVGSVSETYVDTFIEIPSAIGLFTKLNGEKKGGMVEALTADEIQAICK